MFYVNARSIPTKKIETYNFMGGNFKFQCVTSAHSRMVPLWNPTCPVKLTKSSAELISLGIPGFCGKNKNQPCHPFNPC